MLIGGKVALDLWFAGDRQGGEFKSAVGEAATHNP
jgi:hypothetical protein